MRSLTKRNSDAHKASYNHHNRIHRGARGMSNAGLCVPFATMPSPNRGLFLPWTLNLSIERFDWKRLSHETVAEVCRCRLKH